jgi:hypothetical protein
MWIGGIEEWACGLLSKDTAIATLIYVKERKGAKRYVNVSTYSLL